MATDAPSIEVRPIWLPATNSSDAAVTSGLVEPLRVLELRKSRRSQCTCILQECNSRMQAFKVIGMEQLSPGNLGKAQETLLHGR